MSGIWAEPETIFFPLQQHPSLYPLLSKEAAGWLTRVLTSCAKKKSEKYTFPKMWPKARATSKDYFAIFPNRVICPGTGRLFFDCCPFSEGREFDWISFLYIFEAREHIVKSSLSSPPEEEETIVGCEFLDVAKYVSK